MSTETKLDDEINLDYLILIRQLDSRQIFCTELKNHTSRDCKASISEASNLKSQVRQIIIYSTFNLFSNPNFIA